MRHRIYNQLIPYYVFRFTIINFGHWSYFSYIHLVCRSNAESMQNFDGSKVSKLIIFLRLAIFIEHYHSSNISCAYYRLQNRCFILYILSFRPLTYIWNVQQIRLSTASIRSWRPWQCSPVSRMENDCLTNFKDLTSTTAQSAPAGNSPQGPAGAAATADPGPTVSDTSTD